MARPGLEAFRAYLGTKREQWIRQAESQGISLRSYIQYRGSQSLAEEFRQDDQFWSAKICEFLSSSPHQDVSHLIATVSGYWDPELGVAATIILAGLQLACSSPKTESWAAPLAIAGGIAMLIIILSLIDKKE